MVFIPNTVGREELIQVDSCRTLEEFLASNRVRYEHHDVATDEAAREYLKKPRYFILTRDDYR